MNGLKRIICTAIAVLVAGASVGRLCARQAAKNYGEHLSEALEFVGTSTFGDTHELEEMFAQPPMANYANRVHALFFLGGDYKQLLDELHEAMVYLSQQKALATDKRFAALPTLKHLKLVSTDRSDSGIVSAATALLADYNSHF